jgi:hypothetical protein
VLNAQKKQKSNLKRCADTDAIRRGYIGMTFN